MGGLFGGGAKKTTIKHEAAPQVTAILKDVMGRIENEDMGQFIARQYQSLTPEQRQDVNTLAQSGNIRQAASLLSGQFSQGMQQVADNNKYLQAELDKPVTVNQVLSDANVAKNGALNQGALSQAKGAASSSLSNSAGARVAMKRNAKLMTAQNAFSQAAKGAGNSINRQFENKTNRLANLNTMAGMANNNINTGLRGQSLQQQAIQNQLTAGNILQQDQQNAYSNAYQNANAAAKWPTDQLNNKMNMITQAANMAGYTEHGTQSSGVSTGQRVLGAGLAIGSQLGQLGAFSGSPTAWQTQQDLNNGVTNFDQIKSGQYQSPSWGNSFWNRANQRMGFGNYTNGGF